MSDAQMHGCLPACWLDAMVSAATEYPEIFSRGQWCIIFYYRISYFNKFLEEALKTMALAIEVLGNHQAASVILTMGILDTGIRLKTEVSRMSRV